MQTIQNNESSVEQTRLQQDREGRAPWKKWGPYLSERQWATVREDYSANGDAWNYFTHDQAQYRAYRWGEDGLAGISDDRQLLCFAPALWNGRDPILKERLFGLSNSEGNHGEDVKEYYFYLDNTPTHSYMKYLYKYPHAAYPYQLIIDGNRTRDKHAPEYELLDTGIFDEDRYFDVFVEYAKAEPEDMLIQISVCNRGPEPAEIHVLPVLWFRNTWSWSRKEEKPELKILAAGADLRAVAARHRLLGERFLYCEGAVDVLFTENETNSRRAFNQPNQQPYCKDGIIQAVVHGIKNAINPDLRGTKASAHYRLTVAAGKSETVRLRLTDQPPDQMRAPFGDAFAVPFEARRSEADAFYDGITPDSLTKDEAHVMRQALSGMLWSKQYFHYDVAEWLREHGDKPEEGVRAQVRNKDWFHMYNADIISMPDKWEYPWYAVWDLAFHTVPLSLVDADFAKEQLRLFLGHHYLHPNGQMPAYEWNFNDVNPPVHAWAVWAVYSYEKQLRERGDLAFLKFCFEKLSLNFTWWVNRKDVDGNNVFGGGFLGLDNIGVFDRSSALPAGGYLEQSDGTAWMAFFASVMLQIAVELAMEEDPHYEAMALKYFEHFLWIASAMDNLSHTGVKLWDQDDGIYYDVLRSPDGSGVRLKVRSLVGLVPLAATTVLPADLRERLPRFFEQAQWFLERHPYMAAILTVPLEVGAGGNRILSLVNQEKLRRILGYMLNENEFLSPYGIRSLSRYHAEHPYVFKVGGQEFRIGYVPGDSDSWMFGGNSNWRGPIWMPMQLVLIRALVNQYAHLGPHFKIECPVGSGRQLNLLEVSQELARRLSRLFILNEHGRRPAHGNHSRWSDEHWRDHVLFYEYFHGDTGAGIGASHQTGWTGVIAFLMQGFKELETEKVLEKGMDAVTEGSAEVAKERGTPEAAAIAKEVHEQVAEKVVAQVLKTVKKEVTEAVQDQGGGDKVQEKVQEIVIEKVAKAVQKEAEDDQQKTDKSAEEKKEVL
jgi:Glycosyl hydrolase family 63 C-terminal domain